MVWDCIKTDGRKKLIKPLGNLNSEIYIGLLRSKPLPVYQDEEFFKHDKDLCHTSRVAKIFLVDEVVQRLKD